MDLSQYAGYLSGLHNTTVKRFTKTAQDSGYVGKTYVWEPAETLSCGKYPVKDEQSIELYGPRVNQMFRLHFDPGTVINDGDGISFDTAASEPAYKVIGAVQRELCAKATVEVIGVGD